LRYAAVPFLLLFNLSVLLAILAGLDLAGIWEFPTAPIEAALGYLGPVGTVVYTLLAVNVAIAGIMVLIWIPVRFVLQDIKKAVNRFELVETEFTVDPNEPYLEAAGDIFDEHPETVVFCYGHTHRPAVNRRDGGVVVNTGTWLKRFHRRDVIAGLLPPVFHPTFRLSIVRIAAEPEGVAVEYETMEKPDPAAEDLTLTERLLTVGRVPEPDIPERVVVDPDRVPGHSVEESTD
jgi:hypothetical protein